MDETTHFQPSKSQLCHATKTSSRNVLITHTQGSHDLEKIMRKANIGVTHIPMLEIAPIQIGKIRQTACCIADTWIFLSRHSTTGNSDLLRRCLQDQTVIAIGPGTQDALEDQGIGVDQIPEKDHSSDGIAQLSYLNNNQQRRVLIFSETSTPSKLRNKLKQQGHQVAHVATYQHQARESQKLAEAILPILEQITDITTHSPKGLLQLLQCTKQEQLQILLSKTLLVTNKTMQSLARKNGFSQVICSHDNAPIEIYNTLNNHWTRTNT